MNVRLEHFVVQSIPADLVNNPAAVWIDEEMARSRILGYGALGKHRKHGAPGHLFRLVKRIVFEELVCDHDHD